MAVFADLVRDAQAARAGPSRTKWFNSKPSPCGKPTKSRPRRWFVRQPPCKAEARARPGGASPGSVLSGRQLEVVAGHRLDPSARKNAASTRCSDLARRREATTGRGCPAFPAAAVLLGARSPSGFGQEPQPDRALPMRDKAAETHTYGSADLLSAGAPRAVIRADLCRLTARTLPRIKGGDSSWRGWSFAGGHGFQLVKRVADELRQVSLVGLLDPAFERDSEDGDPGLGGQACRGVTDAAPAQRVGGRGGE
jgi:hypothetical protein